MTGIDDEIESRIQDIWLARNEKPVKQLKGALRQILIVNDVVFYSATYRPSKDVPQPKSEAVLHLFGKPSASSEVKQGFIRFVPKDQLGQPHYDPHKKAITLRLEQTYMHQVIEQTKHTKRYLWIGEFPGGHLYGDLHSGD